MLKRYWDILQRLFADPKSCAKFVLWGEMFITHYDNMDLKGFSPL